MLSRYTATVPFWIAMAVLGGAGPGAQADPCIITENTLIDANNVGQYEGCDLIVRGATVTIDVPLMLNSLVVEMLGNVNHSIGNPEGLTLTVANDVYVEFNSEIDLNGRGYGPGEGPGKGLNGNTAGGAGHGGAGHDSLAGASGGGCYGDVFEPTEFGSGGGKDIVNGNPGGSGGGVFRLTVGGTLTVDGAIRANGDSSGGYGAGGGSGGSLWLTAHTLAGEGTIEARGGYASSNGGGGGGGRVAVYVDQLEFDDTQFRVNGADAQNAYDGGAGTAYVQVGTQRGTIIIDNQSVDGDRTEYDGQVTWDANLIIRGSARLSPPAADPNTPVEGHQLSLAVHGDVLIEPISYITVTALGLPSGSNGPGEGGPGATGGGGGGHGGKGGNGSAPTALGGDVYGVARTPNTLGSAGGRDLGNNAFGGTGGGSMRLAVLGALTVDGGIDANGGNGTERSGGGSGGSLWIEAYAISGWGTIAASGGNGYKGGGGGGGGRVAIYCCDLEEFYGSATAAGGDGHNDGQPGTVRYLPGPTGPVKRLISSSGRAYAFPVSGLLTEQLATLNAGPPPFDPQDWLSVSRKNANWTPEPSFRCDCIGIPPMFECENKWLVPDPLAEPFVSAGLEDYLPEADEVTLDNCGSAFYRFTFELPNGVTGASLAGTANADDQAVVFLNGHQISGTMTVPACNPEPINGPLDPCYDEVDCAEGNPDMFDGEGRQILTWPTRDPFGTCESSYFVAGENELVFALCGDASFFEPTGLEFEATVMYDFPYSLRGDVNCDGIVGFGDINPFIKALGNPASYKQQFPDCDIMNGDINEDGSFDFGDINPFIKLLAGP